MELIVLSSPRAQEIMDLRYPHIPRVLIIISQSVMVNLQLLPDKKNDLGIIKECTDITFFTFFHVL